MKQLVVGVTLALLGDMGTAWAALQPAGNGQVYDDVLNISWLQDANFVKTSCDENNALWLAFNPATIVGNSGRPKAQICSDTGLLNWNEAEGWIAVLNANNHLGHSDWRQPATGPVNGSLFNTIPAFDGSTDSGFNISASGSAFPGSTGSELAYMYYNNLGNPSAFDTEGNDQRAALCPAANCLTNTGPFQNLLPFTYWSGTIDPTSTVSAFSFNLESGDQRNTNFFSNVRVWPVRPGQDVGAPAPEDTPDSSAVAVPTLSELGLAMMILALLLVAAGRFRKYKA